MSREGFDRRRSCPFNVFNAGPADLVVVLPITSKSKGVLYHVEVLPPEGGLTLTSYIKCEDIRSIAKDRLLHRRGAVTLATMFDVEDRLRILLGSERPSKAGSVSARRRISATAGLATGHQPSHFLADGPLPKSYAAISAAARQQFTVRRKSNALNLIGVPAQRHPRPR